MSDERDHRVDRFFALSLDLLCIVGFDGDLRRVNPALERLLGRTEAELLHDPIFDYVHPDERAAFAARLRQIERAQPVAHLEVRLRSADGSYRQVSWSARPDPDAREIYAVGRDVTERRHLEERQRERQERQVFALQFSDALRPIGDPATIAELACRMLVEQLNASRAQFTEVEGDPGAEIGTVRGEYIRIGQPMTRRYPLGAFGEPLVAVLRAGQSLVLTDTGRDPRLTAAQREEFTAVESPAAVAIPLVKEGRFLACFTVHNATPRHWAAGEVALIEETAERTWAAFERARAEERVRESEEKYRTLFDSIDEGFALCEMIPDECGKLTDFRYLAVNAAFETLTGLPVATTVGRTVHEILPPPFDDWVDTYAQVVETNTPVRFERYLVPLARWLSVYCLPRGDLRFAALFSDITERMRADEVLRASEERQAFLLKLSDALRPLTDPVAVQMMAMKLLAERLDVMRASYFEIDEDRDSFHLTARFERNAPPMPERMRLSDFSLALRDAYTSGRTLSVADTTTEGEFVPDSDASATYASIGVAAWAAVPLVRNGQLVAWLGVHSASRREWHRADLQVLEDVAERTWSTVEQARAEEALRESERRYRGLLSASNQVLYRHNADWSEMRQLTGGGFLADTTSPDPNWFDAYIHPDDQPQVWAAIQAAIRAKRLFELEHRVVRADGSLGWTLSRSTPILDDQGEIVEWFGAASDVTARREADEARRASEERLQLALDASGMGTFVWYPAEDRGEPDARMLALFGQPPDGTLTLKSALATMIDPEDAMRYADAVARALDPAGSGILQEDIRVRQPDGSVRWVTIYGQVAFAGEPRRPVRMAGIGMDITGRKRAEQELQRIAEADAFRVDFADAMRPLTDPKAVQSEAARLLSEWLGASRALYITVDDEAGRYEVEREFRRPGLAGVAGRYRYDQVDPALLVSLRAGKTAVVTDVAKDPRASAAKRAAYMDIGTAAFVDVPLVKRGRLIALLSIQTATPREWSPGEIAIIEETAERTWAAVARAASEQALRESEARYRTLFETIDEGYVSGETIRDQSGAVRDYRILEINPAFERLNGQPAGKIVGKTIREIAPEVDAIWLETIGRVIADRRPIRLEHVVEGSGRWYDCYFAPAGEDEPERFVAEFTEITERKRAEIERERAREQAEAAVRARDEFLSIASHELRNPVAAIKATAQLMQRLHDRGRLDTARLERYIQTVNETSERLATLVDDLLDVSRLETGRFPLHLETLDLATLVRRAIRAVETGRPGIGRHRFRLAVDDGRVMRLDPERMQQVVVNLLDNALKYSPEGGEVRILLTDETTGALVRVQDDGIGLPHDSLESIFEPFGRAANATSSQIRGLGLGLYIARRIVRAHGGRLWAESDGEGHGTTICLWLPGMAGEQGDAATSRAGGR